MDVVVSQVFNVLVFVSGSVCACDAHVGVFLYCECGINVTDSAELQQWPPVGDAAAAAAAADIYRTNITAADLLNLYISS